MKFTKEQLISAANARMEFAEMMMTKDLLPLQIRNWSIEAELARIALASLEAEAVGEVVLGEYDDCGCHPDARVVCIAADGQADWENFKDGTRLYAAPPSLAAIDERAAFNTWNNDENLPIAGVGAKNAAWLAWQARSKLTAPPAPAHVNAEPVAWLWSHRKHPSEVTLVRPEDDERAEGAHWSGWSCQALYAAPPAPVSVPDEDLLHMAASAIDDLLSNKDRSGAGVWADIPAKLRRAAMLQGSEPVTTAYKLQDGWVACSERMPEKGRTLALFGKRIKEVCVNYVDEGYIGDDGEFYFFDLEGGPRIDDCHPYDKAIVTHWMYWDLPAAPQQEV
ncbi:DUF551 domain-containing protein [Enterobacter kobei]|uniref:DUF551 domain-containing protein n=1 Tax=Enterobacter kobei TaxID=208224 RepID=UPI00064365AE|nr:DUF551 domain-containing protein [Enterobacter kobei]KLP25541.1 hypothetical protein YA51_15215 [Enterobacter kobei]